MSQRMTLQQDLSAIWENIVEAGLIKSLVKAADDRSIECGVRLGKNGLEHYAMEVETGKPIPVDVRERAISHSPFRIQWNESRSLKPHIRPLGRGRQPDISPEIDDCFFACQDAAHPLSILGRSLSLHIVAAGAKWAAFHNALPVEKEGHFLWVPVDTNGAQTAFPHSPQLLTRQSLEAFLAVARATTSTLTFFNALHAGASVNHIHFHSIYRKRRLALEDAPLISVGDYRLLDQYPASGVVFPLHAPCHDLWTLIDRLQAQDIPLNLIAIADRVYLIPRNAEQEVVDEFPGGVIASMEISGKVITTIEDYFNNADCETVWSGLAKVTLNQGALREALGI